MKKEGLSAAITGKIKFQQITIIFLYYAFYLTRREMLIIQPKK